MEQIITRPATLADLDTLLAFEQGIITAERPFDPTLREGEIHYYDLSAYIASPDVEVTVAELNGEIIGSGYARLETAKDYYKHERYAYLGFMYVKPEFRGRGVNSTVLEALKTWVRSRGISEIRLEVYHNNYPAVKAYEKAGFSKNLVLMRMNLDD